MAGFALLAGVVVALVIVFVKFHKQVMAVIKAMGGLKGVLIGLLIAMTALPFVRMITGMMAVGVAAEGASGKVALLRISLLRLGLLAIPAIVIPVVYNISESLGHAKPDHRKIKYGTGITGLFGRAVSAAEYGILRLQGKSPKQARAMTLSDVQKAGGLPGTSVVIQGYPQKNVDLFLKILNDPSLSPYSYALADAAYKAGDDKALRKIYANMTIVL